MTITEDRPTIAERVTSASNSSDLSVRIDARGDADYLIAAGRCKSIIGRHVQQLMAEWDACAKPRAVTDQDLERVAEQLPRITITKQGRRGPKTVQVLDMASARQHFDAWMVGERRRILGRLHSLPKLMDEHAGLLPWVSRRGYTNPREKLLDVLGWWADRRCAACGGTGIAKDLACKACRGLGERDIPHGREGQEISEHIAAQVASARHLTREALKQLKALKRCAAGLA